MVDVFREQTGKQVPTTAFSGMVLLVEDDAVSAEMIEAMLIELGYGDVVVAATIDEAMRAVATGNPQLVILDAMMRGTPAYKVAAALRDKNVPFVVSTGYDPRTLPVAFDYGVPLRKPYGVEALAAAVEKARARA